MRITNDAGVAHKTRILANDGTDITTDLRVRSMDLHIECGKVVKATMDIVMPEVEVCAFLSEDHRQATEDRLVKQLATVRALKE